MEQSPKQSPAAVADLIERLTKEKCRLENATWEDGASSDYVRRVLSEASALCGDYAASLSQLSTKLENAERERDEARAAVKAVERGMFRTRKRAESAEQERDELRAKLAEAREALEPFGAKYADITPTADGLYQGATHPDNMRDDELALVTLTVGDLRRARAAIKGAGQS